MLVGIAVPPESILQSFPLFAKVVADSRHGSMQRHGRNQVQAGVFPAEAAEHV